MPHRGRRDSQAGLSSARLVSPRCERTSWLATEHAEEESHAVFFTAYLRDLRFAMAPPKTHSKPAVRLQFVGPPRARDSWRCRRHHQQRPGPIGARSDPGP
jgi:hypothetical protein